eukprot:Amastigsp_a341290_34.p2 type:complete len:191 gc:universal Amastigsp_a341290_34:1243-1815(+)
MREGLRHRRVVRVVQRPPQRARVVIVTMREEHSSKLRRDRERRELIGTLEHSHRRSRVAPQKPPQFLVGVVLAIIAVDVPHARHLLALEEEKERRGVTQIKVRRSVAVGNGAQTPELDLREIGRNLLDDRKCDFAVRAALPAEMNRNHLVAANESLDCLPCEHRHKLRRNVARVICRLARSLRHGLRLVR